MLTFEVFLHKVPTDIEGNSVLQCYILKTVVYIKKNLL